MRGPPRVILEFPTRPTCALAEFFGMPSWMTVVLAMLAGGAICLVLLVFAARFFLGRLLKGLLASAMGAAVRITPQVLDEPPVWKKPGQVEGARSFFERKGFRQLHYFQVEELEGLICCGLLSPEGSAVVLYDHAQLGFWIDLVRLREGRGALTVTSQQEQGNLKQAPFAEKYGIPGAGPEELWNLFQEKLKGGEARYRAMEESEFLNEFQRAYADEMDWRNAQGGPTREEIRSVLKAGGKSPSEEEIDDVWEIQSAQSKAALQEGLRLRLAEQGFEGADPDELVVVHERLDEEELFFQLSRTVDDEEYEPTGFTGEKRGLSPAEAFEMFQQSLPEALRFRPVGSWTSPLRPASISPRREGCRWTSSPIASSQRTTVEAELELGPSSTHREHVDGE